MAGVRIKKEKECPLENRICEHKTAREREKERERERNFFQLCHVYRNATATVVAPRNSKLAAVDSYGVH